MGRTGRVARRHLALGTAAVTVAAAGVAVAVSGPDVPLAQATTVLRHAAGVTVEHTDGVRVAGVDGMRVRPGDIVRTSATGRADLGTRGRAVRLGPDTAVQVVDGARQTLRRGDAVVDAQHGPALSLTVDGDQVAVPSGAAARLDRGTAIRVAALAGRPAVVTSDAGRRLTVPALAQVVTSGAALPSRTAPLRLTDDDVEARTVPDLVRDDRALLALAAGIDATGPTTTAVVLAAWHGPTVTLPSGVAGSERVLPVALADALPQPRRDAGYRSAVALRSAGASWAVVARLVGAPVTGAVAALAALERAQAPGQVGTLTVVAAATPRPASNPNVPATGGRSTGDGTGSAPSGPARPPSGSSGSPAPAPTPTPSGGLVGTVVQTVTPLLSALPLPVPSTSTAGTSGATGLLSGVVGAVTSPLAPVGR